MRIEELVYNRGYKISEDRIKNKLSYRDLEIKYSIPYSSIYGMINRYRYDS